MAKLRWEEVYEDNEDLFYAEGYGGDGGYWLARNTREAQGNVGKWHVTLNIGGKDHGVKADGTLAFSKKGYYFDTICAAKAAAQQNEGPVVGAKVSSSKSATWKWKSKTRDRKIISYYAQGPASALEAGVNIVRWGPNEWTLQSGGAPSGHSLVIVKTGYKSAAAAKKGAVALGPWVAPPRLIPLKASRPAKPKKKKKTKKTKAKAKPVFWEWDSVRSRARGMHGKIEGYNIASPPEAFAEHYSITWTGRAWQLTSGWDSRGTYKVLKRGFRSAADAQEYAQALHDPKAKAKKPKSSSSLPSIAELNQQAATPRVGIREEAETKALGLLKLDLKRSLEQAGGLYQATWWKSPQRAAVEKIANDISDLLKRVQKIKPT